MTTAEVSEADKMKLKQAVAADGLNEAHETRETPMSSACVAVDSSGLASNR